MILIVLGALLIVGSWIMNVGDEVVIGVGLIMLWVFGMVINVY